MVQMDTSLPASIVVTSPQLAAFEVLFAEQRDRLLSALWLITRDRHEAEDIAQDAFVRVLERWDREAPPTIPRPTSSVLR